MLTLYIVVFPVFLSSVVPWEMSLERPLSRLVLVVAAAVAFHEAARLMRARP